jgi:hypothetical protein
MIKMKNRRGKIDLGIKLCKNCTKEYHETDNFNWSCKTHKSEFGGEMWWCCGKKEMNAPGCKTAKHESKEEEDDEENVKKLESEDLKRKKCLCCK